MKVQFEQTAVFSKFCSVLIFAAVAAGAGIAVAQQQPTEEVAQPAEGAPLVPISDQEKEVIDALAGAKAYFLKGDLPSTQAYLEEAFLFCDEHDVQGELLAKTYMSLGALFVGYLQQEESGVEFMEIALSIDNQARPDAEYVNDQVGVAYNDLRQRLGLGTAGMGAKKSIYGKTTLAGSFWVLRHEPVTDAKRMHPLGFFIETNPLVAVQAARIYLRFPGDRNYMAAQMMRNGQLYGMMVGCETFALLDPRELYYYMEVVGGDGNIVGRVGDAQAPIKVTLVDEEKFEGEQPNLPGMAPHAKCQSDDAAPCPPWDPHCKQTLCVTSEDCLPGNTCQEGYCTEDWGMEEDDSKYKPIGLVLSLGAGGGFGVNSRFALSPLFTRASLSYFVMDNLSLGLFVRFQQIFTDGFENHHGAIAGLMVSGDEFTEEHDNASPMWGPTATLFIYGDGKPMGPGQVRDRQGYLTEDQGLRLYTRFEFNVYGRMYHVVDADVQELDENGQAVGSSEVKPVQKRSGPLGAGLGLGLLYGLHRNIDVGVEMMIDTMFPDFAFNVDGQLQFQFHF